MSSKMPAPPPVSLGFLINDVARLFRRNFNRRVQKLDLTQAQWQILAHVSRNEGMRQSQLAEILELQPISVGRLIDRMQAAGWIDRRPDPSDRRAFKLFLTDKATPILEQMRSYSGDMHKEVLQEISNEDEQLLLALLTRIRENLIQSSDTSP